MSKNKRLKKRLHQSLFFPTIILLAVAVLSACGRNSLYEKNVDLDKRMWIADSTFSFTFKVTDPSPTYDIFLNVRNTLAYPYQNIYIQSEMKNGQGEVLLKQLNNIQLFDTRSGKPFGKGLGDIFSHEYKAITGYQFSDTGQYTIELQQYMRRDTLPELLSVGIGVVEKSIDE
jgi:gliding motility-associated lipoprotein GldH